MANPSSSPAPATSSASGPDRKTRVGILISGRGSNMAALIEAAAAPGFPAEIVLVLSNKAGAAGLERAAAAGIATVVIPHRGHADRENFDRAMDAELAMAGVEIVCLAGFMRLLSPWFCRQWDGRLINIHPALLPAFKGLDTHARALAEGVKIHGCTVHFVVPEMDAGPIIAQSAVPVLDADTEESLGARVLKQEHALYPRALRLVASGAVRIDGGRVIGAAADGGDGVLAVPAG